MLAKDQGREIQNKIFRKMTPEQKLMAALRLYHSAYALKRASLKSRHPDWTEKQIATKLKEIFLDAQS